MQYLYANILTSSDDKRGAKCYEKLYSDSITLPVCDSTEDPLRPILKCECESGNEMVKFTRRRINTRPKYEEMCSEILSTLIELFELN